MTDESDEPIFSQKDLLKFLAEGIKAIKIDTIENQAKLIVLAREANEIYAGILAEQKYTNKMLKDKDVLRVKKK